MAVNNNFGKINGMIELTAQTDTQRNAFSNFSMQGNALGANRTASSLFSGIGRLSDDTAQSIQSEIRKSYYNLISANNNPDFNITIFPSYFMYPQDFMTTKPIVSDKPNILGPNIETLKIGSDGQPDTQSREASGYSPRTSPTLLSDSKFAISTQGFGSRVVTNTPNTSAIGNYLSRKYSSDGNLSIKKGESIDHDNLDYEN